VKHSLMDARVLMATAVAIGVLACRDSKRSENQAMPSSSDRTAPENSDLLARRIVILRGTLDDAAANELIAKLLYLQSVDAVAPIRIYLDSPGGDVVSALAIRDTIDDLKPPVYTHGLANVQGAAALLLAHGARGRRSVMAHGHVSFTPISSAQGDARGIETVIVELLASDTGQRTQQIETDLRASRRFEAEQARAYGLVDRVEP
jgi:ATP-dependent Clp protease protease subunit